MYLAVVLDALSRWIVRWAMGTNLKTQSVLDTMNMAIGQRRPSDVSPSIGSVGDTCDHATCESFFATPKCKLLDRRKFRTKAKTRMAAFDPVEGWYNPGRKCSALGYLSPID